MTQCSAPSSIQLSSSKARSLFPDVCATLAVAALLAATIGARAQAPAPDAAAQAAVTVPSEKPALSPLEALEQKFAAHKVTSKPS